MGLKDLELFAQQEAETSAQSQAVNQSLSRGLGENPDEYAKLLKLSAQTGIAPDLAKDYRPELERRQKLQDLSVDDLVRSNPKTSRFLADPSNAAVAHDDVENLSLLEQVLLKPVDYTRALGKAVVSDVIGRTVSGASTALDVAARAIDRPIRNVFGDKIADLFWYEPLRVQGISLDPLDAVRQGGKGFKELGEIIAPPKERRGFDTDVVQGIGQLGGQIAVFLLTGGGSSAITLYAQGTDVMAEKVEKDNADQVFKDAAIVLGGPVTMITEKYGLDKILNRVPPEIKNRTLRFIADKAIAGGVEAAQEITEALLMDLTRRVFTNETAPILEGALNEGSVAAVSAAIVRSALGVRGYREAKQQEEIIKALSGDSKLRERLPEKYRDFVAQVTEDGPVQNVFIPVEQFNKFFQSQDMDPAQAAEQFGVKNYEEAVGLGADVVIPMDRFAADLAPTDYLQGLAADIKFEQGGMTPRERELYLANQEAQDAEIERIIAQQDAQGGVIQAIQEIVTDVEGQLVSVGTDPSTARSQATALRGVAVLVERDLRARAEASGEQVTDEQVLEAVREVWKGYGLDISRPMPDVLTQRPNVDINIDPLLDALRAGNFPSEQTVMGNSLVEFVRSKGGLAPRGELVDVDLDNRPFQRNLVQPGGLTIERAATLAVEAGYFPGMESGQITETDLLDALDNEIRGQSTTFSAIETNTDALAMREAMNSLSEYLGSLGIDLNAVTDNAQVRALIDAARNTPELGGVISQLDQLAQRVLVGEIRTLPGQIEVDGVMRPTTNNEGRQIHPTQEGAVNFWRWFGNSTAVDEQGRPRVMYHGTGRDFDAFDIEQAGSSTDTGNLGTGFYVTPEDFLADSYARMSAGDANVMPLYARTENTLNLGTLDENYIEAVKRLSKEWGLTETPVFDGTKQKNQAWSDEFAAAVQANGYDGVAAFTPAGEMFQMAVFEASDLKSATGNLGSFDPNNTSTLYQFAGQQAKTADMYAMINAKARIEKGESPEIVRRETGWFMGVDGMWRFEIADDEAKFNTSAIVTPESLSAEIGDQIQVGPDPKQPELFKATWGEGNQYRGAFGRTEAEAEINLLRVLAKDRNVGAFDLAKISDGEVFALSEVLDHPKLYAAYPDLAGMAVRFVENAEYRGAYYPNQDRINISLTGDQKQMLSTLLHEIQHAIQQREGFAKGGNTDSEFTGRVRDALDKMEKEARQSVDYWKGLNKDKIDDAEKASEVARFGLMWESAQRLIDYSARAKPSGVFRLIRNELQWIYAEDFRDNPTARDVQRDFYAIPRSGAKRNQYIGDMAFRGAQILLNQIPTDLREQFKADPRTMKGMINALRRESSKKRKALAPLNELEGTVRRAVNVRSAYRYSTPFQIYEALAGEVEARNTQARQQMTDAERQATSPMQTADVPAERIVVMFGGMDIQAPMASTLMQDAGGSADVTQKPGFQAWSNGHPVVRMGDDHTFQSGEGVVVESIHATTGDFDTFDRSKGNIESDLGAGFYSTNNTADAAANYAGMGPDLTNKIEREAERISNEIEDQGEMPDASQDEIQAEAQRRAREKFMANEGLTMPVFVRFDNPVVIGGEGETFLDYNEEYNEELDEYGEPTGKLVDLVMAVRELGDDGSFEMDTEAAVDALMQDAMDNGGLKASEAIESLKKALVYAVDYETGDSATNEIVRQVFERAGFDGFIDITVNKKFGSEKRVGKAMEGMDSETVHFIAFKPNQMASRTGSTWERGDVGDSILRQGENLDDKRGFIQFGKERKFNIVLLEKANLSTFLHETGHFYLEVLGDLATAPGASEAITQDYAKVLKFLGLESRDQLTLDGKAPGSAEYKRAVEAHEKFARANEAYLMEGNAPTPELRDVFQRFKSWMTMIYRQISSLNVKLTDEVREVFDRVYATDAEIEAAKGEVNVDPLFLDAATAGMTQAEFEAYRASVVQATESGKEALTAKLMRELMRARKTWWKEARETMRAEVEKEVDAQPVYQAFKTLVGGKMDDDTEIKLNKESLIKKYGADFVKRLPRSFGRIYTTKGGMDADTAAEFLSFESGDALIEALVGMRDRKQLIEAETDQRMREVHGDMMTDGTIADEAKIAMHNSQRENLLMAELRALRRKQREVAPFVKLEREKAKEDRRNARAAADVPPAQAFRRAAVGLIGQTPLRDLDANRYLLASRRAAKQAFDAMSKGDYMLAADAKQKELLNHFMYLEARKAKEQADKILKYAAKFEKGATREQMGKAGGTYLEQIDAILDRYEFRRVPLSKLDRRASLADWIAEQEALGLEPSISAELLNEARQVNYRQASIDELRAVYDAVRNIEHLARLKNKLLTKQAEIAFDDAIAELVAAAENMTAGKSGKSKGQRKPLPLDMSAMTMREKAADTVSRMDGMLLKMEQVVEWLDNGNVNGPWHTYLWNPIAEAQTAEYDLTRQLTERMSKALEAMPKEQRLSMLDTFNVPGMGKVTRKFLISVALNMGNQGNIDKMMRGMGWDMAQIERGLAKLNDADWTFVQETWDTINSVWPQIAELEKRMTGLEPPKVEAQPYQVRNEQGEVTRTLEGGYYPLVYDPRLSEQGAKQEAGNLGQLFEEGYVRATTPKGHTQARMEGFAAPLLFDFEQVVTQHMAKVVKDLTHREAVVMANKILTNREVRSVLQETMGPAYEKQMLPWLRSVVNDRNGGSVQGLTDFSRWMMSARANIVAAVMGFKATTAISQITGISQSLDKVKGRYIGQALLEFMRHPVATTRQVRELSGEMRNRSNTLDRDIRDQLRNLTGQNSTWAQAQRFAFHGIAIADAMVTVPTWMGAYRQALDSGADESTARLEADAAVRLTQGGAGAKDLAAIQRNNELAKAVTMFYSYFSVLYNRQRDMGRDVQEIRDLPRFLSRVFFTIMVPAVMGELILGRGPDEDEEPEAWAIRKVLLYPLMSVPILRDVVSSIDSGYDYRFSPMATVFDKIGKAATSTGKVIEGDIDWDQYALKVAETIGYVFGVAGTAQISATGKYLWRVSEGEENPDNIAELLAYALLGKRKED